MTKCPKCSGRIRAYQMSPYCKSCGVNLMFASFEEQFEKDRRIAEMSMANFRYQLVRLKSSYISGRPRKFRLIAAIIPLIALLLPLGNLEITAQPVYSASVDFNIFGLVVSPFMNGTIMRLDALSSGPVFGGIASSLKTVIIVYLIMTLCAVLIFLFELLSFIGNKAVSLIISALSAAGIISAAAFRICASSLIKEAAGAGPFAAASCNVLFIIAMVLFIVPLLAGIWCFKIPPVYEFKEGDELRVEYRRKYKKGQIKLFDIPAPIYESTEDKEEKRRLISEAYNNSEGQVSDNG